jgi:hypothetical protein
MVGAPSYDLYLWPSLFAHSLRPRVGARSSGSAQSIHDWARSISLCNGQSRHRCPRPHRTLGPLEQAPFRIAHKAVTGFAETRAQGAPLGESANARFRRRFFHHAIAVRFPFPSGSLALRLRLARSFASPAGFAPTRFSGPPPAAGPGPPEVANVGPTDSTSDRFCACSNRAPSTSIARYCLLTGHAIL